MRTYVNTLFPRAGRADGGLRAAIAAGLLAGAGLATAPALGQGQASQAAAAAEAAPSEVERLAGLIRAQKPGDALQFADDALRKNPRNAQVRFMRAVLLGDLGRRDEAGAAFEAMNQDFPELPEPYNNLAVLHAAEGRYEQARALLLRALDVQPNYATALENLGDLHIAMAADAYGRAAKLDAARPQLGTKLALAREADAKVKAAR